MIVRPILLVQKFIMSSMNILRVGHIGFQWSVRTWAWKTPLHCSTHALSLSLSRGRHFAGKRVSSRKFSPFFLLFSRLRYFIFKLTCIPRRFVGIFSKAKRISAAFWKNSWVFCNPVISCTCDLLCRKNLCHEWRSIKQLLFPVEENCIMYPIFVRQNQPSDDPIRIP